jgi:hypothetical protein
MGLKYRHVLPRLVCVLCFRGRKVTELNLLTTGYSFAGGTTLVSFSHSYKDGQLTATLELVVTALEHLTSLRDKTLLSLGISISDTVSRISKF